MFEEEAQLRRYVSLYAMFLAVGADDPCFTGGPPVKNTRSPFERTETFNAGNYRSRDEMILIRLGNFHTWLVRHYSGAFTMSYKKITWPVTVKLIFELLSDD